jgi:hypothetical protein
MKILLQCLNLLHIVKRLYYLSDQCSFVREPTLALELHKIADEILDISNIIEEEKKKDLLLE